MSKKKDNLFKQYKGSNLIKPPSRKRLKRQIKSATHLEFGPEQRQLQAEKRASHMQQHRIKDWFGEYQDQLAQIQGQTPRFYNQANAQVGRAENQTSNYAEQLRARLAKEDQGNAALRGATYDPSGSQTNVAANLSRRNLADSARGVISSQGATQRAYLAD
jgi:hypothetical protein